MKNVGLIIIVLLIGFLIGSFTGYGSTFFSFVTKGKFSNQNTQTENNREAKSPPFVNNR